MRTIWLGKLAMLVLLALFAGSAVAQTESQDQGQFKQIKLSEKQVKDFISAQKELAPLASKLEGDAQDPALQEQVEKIAKSTGFSSLDEFEDVAANISLVLAGIDLQTGQFTEPPDQIKKEIDELKQDKQLSQEDKNKILAVVGRLNAAINKALAKPKVREALAKLGAEPAGGSPSDFGILLKTQIAHWGRVVKESGIKVPHQ